MTINRRIFALAAILFATPSSGDAQVATALFLDSFEYQGRGGVLSLDPAAVPPLLSPVSFHGWDNSADLFVGLAGDQLAVYRRAATEMVYQSSSGPAPAANLRLAVGRFDGQDSALDVLALYPGTALFVWSNRGQDQFLLDSYSRRVSNSALTRVTTIPQPASPRADAVLLWGPSTTSALWIEDPMDAGSSEIPLVLPFAPRIVTIGDLDGDALPEVVIASSAVKRAEVLAGSPPHLTRYPLPAGDGLSSVTIVPQNGDPFAELLITNALDGTIHSLVHDGANRFQFTHAPGSPLFVGTWPTDSIQVDAGDELLVHQADSSLPVSVSVNGSTGTPRFIGPAPYVPGRVLGVPVLGVRRSAIAIELNRISLLCNEGPALLQALISDFDLAIITTPTGAEGCIIAQLRQSALFTDAEPDWIFRSSLAAANPVAEWIAADINLAAAHAITLGEPAITVAVLDSGVEGNMLIAHNPNEVADGVDNDGNGVIDDLEGVDFVTGSWGVGPNEDLYQSGGTALEDAVPTQHGSVVAGALVSVAPQITVLSVKLLDASKQTHASKVALGLRYALLRNAKVATMSLAGPNESVVLANAVKRVVDAGMVTIAATGNDGDNRSVGYPALYTNVIAVAAHERPVGGLEPAMWSHSNRGTGLEFSAPGVEVCIAGRGCHTGTSMAAPHLAGTVALMLSIRPDLTPCMLRAILRDTAAEAGAPGYDLERGYGRLNTGAAIARAASSSLPACSDPTLDPIGWRVQRRDFETGIETAKLGGVTRIIVVLDTAVALGDRGFGTTPITSLSTATGLFPTSNPIRR